MQIGTGLLTPDYLLEAPPDYHFTVKLTKSYNAFRHEELVLKCTLNNYRASVKWFKDNVELDKEDESKFVQEKDIMGNCTLKILDASKEDSGKFTCKIVGKIRLVGEEKKEKCVTKTKVTIKGTQSLKGCQSMKNSMNTKFRLQNNLCVTIKYFFELFVCVVLTLFEIVI